MILADVLIDMDIPDPRGTVLTTAMLSAGTKGAISNTNVTPSPITGFVIGDHKVECPDDVMVGGVPYLARGRASRSMAFNHNQNTRTCGIVIPAAPARTCASAAALVYFGPKNDGPTSNLFDYFSLWNVAGSFCVCQLDNGRGLTPGDYALNLESNPSGVTTHSAYQIISPFTWYWLTIFADFFGGVGKLAIYDTTTWAQVGSTISTTLDVDAVVANRAVDRLKFGNGEVGTASSGTTISFFEHIVMDYTSARFPLLPGFDRASARQLRSRSRERTQLALA
jgi:hypothetical protein